MVSAQAKRCPRRPNPVCNTCRRRRYATGGPALLFQKPPLSPDPGVGITRVRNGWFLVVADQHQQLATAGHAIALVWKSGRDRGNACYPPGGCTIGHVLSFAPVWNSGYGSSLVTGCVCSIALVICWMSICEVRIIRQRLRLAAEARCNRDSD